MRSLSDFDVHELSEHPLYFYVGAGLSRAAGLYGWAEIVQRVHGYRVAYETYGGAPPGHDDALANSRYLQEFVSEQGERGIPILSAASADDRLFGRLVLLNLLFRHSEQPFGMPLPFDALDLQVAMWTCQPHGVLTTNYDVLIERACRS